MTFSDNDFNYFSQNQLTKFSACSLNNKGKQKRRNRFKIGGKNNLQAKRAEIFFKLFMQNCHINCKNSQRFGGGVEPANPPPPSNTALLYKPKHGKRVSICPCTLGRIGYCNMPTEKLKVYFPFITIRQSSIKTFNWTWTRLSSRQHTNTKTINDHRLHTIYLWSSAYGLSIPLLGLVVNFCSYN